jgi:glutaminyl-peptide cyclotransferase
LINGYIYANLWLTNYVLKIDTSSGKVVAKLDLSSLSEDAKSKYPGAAEMNGIAYDSVQNKIYVTGKLWLNIYEIKFSH